MFHEINPAEWARAQTFYYFSKMAPTSYSMTVSVDVTHLLQVRKQYGFKFFPAYLWLVTKNLNAQAEFKIAEQDGKVGYFDTLTPFYATWHADTEVFSMMWTEYNDSFAEFEHNYIDNQNKYGDVRGFLSQPQTPPANAYTVSEIPWVDFEHFAVHSHNAQPYYFPSVEAGKITVDGNGRSKMPLSLTCHHATTDGWHIKKFLDSLQSDIDSFEKYL